MRHDIPMESMYAVARRYAGLLVAYGHGDAPDQVVIRMDLGLAHAVCPIDFGKLANFSDADLAHDVGGIITHLNRGKQTMDDFTPRSALSDDREVDGPAPTG